MKSNMVVITNAREGISAAAKRLSVKGHRVAIVGRSPSKTEAVARELETHFQQVDFAQLNEIRKLADQLIERDPCSDLPHQQCRGHVRQKTPRQRGQAWADLPGELPCA